MNTLLFLDDNILFETKIKDQASFNLLLTMFRIIEELNFVAMFENGIFNSNAIPISIKDLMDDICERTPNYTKIVKLYDDIRKTQ